MNIGGTPANLRPPFERGNSFGSKSGATLGALRKCRNLSPETVDYLISVMRNEEEPTVIRVRCAEIILNKALPSPRVRDDQSTVALDEGGTTHLTIEFVNATRKLVIEHEPVGHAPSSPVTNGHDTGDPIDIVFVGKKS